MTPLIIKDSLLRNSPWLSLLHHQHTIGLVFLPTIELARDLNGGKRRLYIVVGFIRQLGGA